MRGYGAYAKVQTATRSHRDTEYELLGKVTGALLRAESPDASLQERYKALLWNDKVWSAFRCDLLEEGNTLPHALKQQLVSIANWVSKETQLALDDRRVVLETLIEVNRQIMEGLKPQMAAAAG